MNQIGLFFLAAAALHFEVTDYRGKKVSGVSVEAGEPSPDGWREVRLLKNKPGLAIVWPYDARVKESDGPGPTPIVVGDPKLAADPYVAAGALLRNEPCSASALSQVTEAFAKGVALLCGNQPGAAAELLGRALQERERQLTRIPSEIYPAAILYGKALLAAGEYDKAAVAFLKALQQRPSDEVAARYRAEALTKAGKPEAAAPQ